MWPVEIEWWYPATIVHIDGDFYDVCYEDGQRSRLAEVQLRPLNVRVGSKVHCRWKGADLYYSGTVSATIKEVLDIQYDDGDSERTIVGMIRVHEDDL
jgi:hypothetical protein